MRTRSTLATLCGTRALLPALLALFITASNANAQDPTFQWIYGLNNSDNFYGLVMAADGGYLAVGSSSSFGSFSDVYVVRTNACGQLVWSKTYDISPGGYDHGYKVVRGLDGGYVIVGSTQEPSTCCSTGYDPFAMKIDDSGNVIWLKTYPGNEDDYAYDIATYSNSGYVIAGRTSSYGNGGSDGLLIRTGLTGAPLWSRTYGGAAGEQFNGVSVAANGDIVAAGYTTSYTNDYDNQIYVVRTNSDLSLQWSHHYGNDSSADIANDVLVMPDGSIAVFGHSNIVSSGLEQPYMLRLSSTGIYTCDAVFLQAESDPGEFTEAKALPNGELAITGFYFNEAAGLGRFDVLLMRVNTSCTKVWARQYGIDWRDQGRSLVPIYSAGVTLPTGYVIAGHGNSYSNGTQDDAYLIRTDRNGFAGCNEYATVIKQTTPGFRGRLALTTANRHGFSCNLTVTPRSNTESEQVCRNCNIPVFDEEIPNEERNMLGGGGVDAGDAGMDAALGKMVHPKGLER